MYVDAPRVCRWPIVGCAHPDFGANSDPAAHEGGAVVASTVSVPRCVGSNNLCVSTPCSRISTHMSSAAVSCAVLSCPGGSVPTAPRKRQVASVAPPDAPKPNKDVAKTLADALQDPRWPAVANPFFLLPFYFLRGVNAIVDTLLH